MSVNLLVMQNFNLYSFALPIENKKQNTIKIIKTLAVGEENGGNIAWYVVKKKSKTPPKHFQI